MSNQDYMPVECLLVPKALFKDERYCSLSTTAKVLYSLMLDRLKYAAQNRWVDQKGKLYVIYPKSEMIRDLNSTRYRVDYAVSELESMASCWTGSTFQRKMAGWMLTVMCISSTR